MHKCDSLEVFPRGVAQVSCGGRQAYLIVKEEMPPFSYLFVRRRNARCLKGILCLLRLSRNRKCVWLLACLSARAWGQ